MSSAPLPKDFATSARWLVQALDPASGVARLIEMTAENYRGASFLDDRMLRPGLNAAVATWEEIAEAMPADARCDARWIFHIGHVGSTLIARMLGELEGVLSIREPRTLRDLAEARAEQRDRFIGPTPAVFSRTFSQEQIALVKTTSFVSEIAPRLVPPGQRSLFLYVTPRAYIANILAGEASLRELAARADKRIERMADRVGAQWPSGTQAELAAAAWACEMTALESAAEVMAGQSILWTNFDEFLGEVAEAMHSIADFFGFPAEAGAIEAIAAGPLIGRYSKALEFAYSPALRNDIIAETGRRHAGDIASALAMLEQAAQDSPLLARALSRTER